MMHISCVTWYDEVVVYFINYKLRACPDGNLKFVAINTIIELTSNYSYLHSSMCMLYVIQRSQAWRGYVMKA